MSEQNIAGRFVVGDGLQQGGVIEQGGLASTGGDNGPELLSDWPFTSEVDLRRFIRKEVHAALDALIGEIRANGRVRL